MNRPAFLVSSLLRQVKIKHRLPGRLRLSVPALTRLTGGYDDYVAAAEDLLSGLPGLHGADINPMTANVLLKYRPDTVAESDVLGWIESLITAGLREYIKLKNGTNIYLRLHLIQAAVQDEVRKIRKDYARR